MLTVLISLDYERALQLCWDLHIIISVDTEDILNDITWTLNIHTIGRNLECQSLSSLAEHLHLQTLTDALDSLYRNHLTHEVVYILIAEFYHSVLHWLWVNIAYLHANLTASELLTEDSCLLKSIDSTIWIYATFETETGISAQTMTTCRLTDPCGMEIGTLENHVLCGLIGTTTLSAKHTSDTHRLLCITDSQVAVRELMLLTIECLERCSLRHRLHNNLMTLHHVCIKGMQRLSIGHHHVVGDIHDVVDRTQANGCQLVLQPFW